MRSKLGPEMKMDVHWIDVRLKSGKVLRNLAVRGGRYITGSASDPDGEGSVLFVATDIQDVRRHSIRFWPFW